MLDALDATNVDAKGIPFTGESREMTGKEGESFFLAFERDSEIEGC